MDPKHPLFKAACKTFRAKHCRGLDSFGNCWIITGLRPGRSRNECRHQTQEMRRDEKGRFTHSVLLCKHPKNPRNMLLEEVVLEDL
jgi:hypothetical protein